jgi:diguanylate cyclase (GGDEF)-like protein
LFINALGIMNFGSDIAARYGGEEFTACLGSTDSMGSQIVSENIKKAIADLQIPHFGSPFQFVTISCGIYAAKSAGRNVIICTDSNKVTCF